MLTKEFLEYEYWINKKSPYRLSKELNMSISKIEHTMQRFGIKKRTIYEARKPEGFSGKHGFSWCGKCKKEKPLSDFHKDKGTKTGVVSTCKGCLKGRHIQYLENINKKRTNIKIKLVIEFGNKCSKCGVEDLPVCCYQFHHHTDNMKSDNYLQPGYVIQIPRYIQKEKLKWIMVCSNCHSIIHNPLSPSTTPKL